MGDFNLPDTDWANQRPTCRSYASQYILDLATSHDLKQVNNVHNGQGVILDLVFLSDPCLKVYRAEDVLLEEDWHHPAFTFSFDVSLPSSSGPRDYLDFRRCDAYAVMRNLQNLTYPMATDHLRVDESFTSFCNYFSTLIQSNTPLRRSANNNFPRWFTLDLKRLVIVKKSLHRKYKVSVTD